MTRTFIASTGHGEQLLPEQRIRAELSGPSGSVELLSSGPASALLVVRHDGNSRRAFVRMLPDGAHEVWIGRFMVVVTLQDERHRNLAAFIRGAQKIDAGCSVRAPMPGLIREVLAARGDAVRKGQRLLTLEAMKMENEITAPIDGTVDECRLQPGVNVDKGEELLHITPHTGQ